MFRRTGCQSIDKIASRARPARFVAHHAGSGTTPPRTESARSPAPLLTRTTVAAVSRSFHLDAAREVGRKAGVGIAHLVGALAKASTAGSCSASGFQLASPEATMDQTCPDHEGALNWRRSRSAAVACLHRPATIGSVCSGSKTDAGNRLDRGARIARRARHRRHHGRNGRLDRALWRSRRASHRLPKSGAEPGDVDRRGPPPADAVWNRPNLLVGPARADESGAREICRRDAAPTAPQPGWKRLVQAPLPGTPARPTPVGGDAPATIRLVLREAQELAGDDSGAEMRRRRSAWNPA